jgi:hypothetical protein
MAQNAASEIFKKPAQINESPNRRKFAQSGHHGRIDVEQFKETFFCRS